MVEVLEVGLSFIKVSSKLHDFEFPLLLLVHVLKVQLIQSGSGLLASLGVLRFGWWLAALSDFEAWLLHLGLFRLLLGAVATTFVGSAI